MRPPMRLLMACALGLLLAGAGSATPWPELPLPAGARAESVAADSVLNGRRSRILRAQFSGSLDEALAFYRAQFGRQHVETPLRDARVIAARQGEHFNTVQLRELAPGRVQATLMSTLMSGAGASSRVLRDTQRLLPPDSTVMNTLESTDQGRRAVMLTALNGLGMQTNRDELVRGLRQRGLRIAREDRTPLARGSALTLWAESAQEELTLSILDAGEQRIVVVNRVRESRQ
jgi:hypothetical protein